MLSWQESLSHDTKHVRSYRELSNIHTILPFPPQLARNLIYLVTLQPPLSSILRHANCTRHHKMYHNNHSYTHQWTTTKLWWNVLNWTSTELQSVVMMTIQRNCWLYKALLTTTMPDNYDVVVDHYLISQVPTYIYPWPRRGLFPYRIEPYILRQCLFSLILFIWF